jgi:hypothetical protein
MNDIKFCTTIQNNIKGKVVYIEGSLTKNHTDYLDDIYSKLEFPNEKHNWDAYLDWMTDLSWIKEKSITIVVKDYHLFLQDDKKYKEFFLSDFLDKLFPFWKYDAYKVFNKESVKSICLFLVVSEENMVLTKSINSNYAEGKKGTTFTISLPVLRKNNQMVHIANFIIHYNADEFRRKKFTRPFAWIESDIVTGTIIHRYHCCNDEFSSGEYFKEYDGSTDGLPEIKKEQFFKMLEIFDIVRLKYIQTGTIDKKIYEQYLKWILTITPDDFKQFIIDLSKI